MWLGQSRRIQKVVRFLIYTYTYKYNSSIVEQRLYRTKRNLFPLWHLVNKKTADRWEIVVISTTIQQWFAMAPKLNI